MCQHSRLLPLHLQAATHLQCSPQAMCLWWWVSQVNCMQTCDWWRLWFYLFVFSWMAFSWMLGSPQVIALKLSSAHDYRAWTIKYVLAVLALSWLCFHLLCNFFCKPSVFFMSSIISDRTAAHKDICFQEVDEDLMCTMPRNELTVTYSECCCHYGRGWGPECRTCPNRNSGIAKKALMLRRLHIFDQKCSNIVKYS